MSPPPSSSGRASSGSGAGRADAIDSLVCFRLADERYAIDVALVREVVSVDKLVRVPRSPAPIAGVFALRGATIALVDTRVLFGVPGAAAGAAMPALVVSRDKRPLCALTIDEVLGVVPFTDAAYSPAASDQEPAQVAGFLHDARVGVVTVLDSPTVLGALARLAPGPTDMSTGR